MDTSLKLVSRGIIAVLLLFSLQSKAVHVWGGELEAVCDGNGNYTVRLSIYADCGRIAGMPASDEVKIFQKNGTLYSTVTLNNIIRDTLPTIPNACATSVVGTCIGRVVSEGTINLPMNADGYVLSYSSCCRNTNINNINNPGGTGQVYVIELPGTNQVATCNSSPIFTALPPSEICTNMPVEIDFAATDNDGDQLKYKIVNPYGTSGTHTTGPPFPLITFTAPYTFSNPMNSGLTIDENTGLITGIPNTTGLFVLGVVVEEYRNGVLIGTKIRDFTYTVVPCAPVFSTGDPSVLTCANSPVQFGYTFNGKLKAGTTPLWDFGDPSSGVDNSATTADPIHQYSGLGTYYATVFVEDSCGNVLRDTIKVDIVETVANVDDPGPVCKGDNVTLTATDTPCDLTEWYETDTSTIPMHIGCSYNFTLADDRKCVFFEPFVDPATYVVGANAEEGWGTDTDNKTTFDAITDLTIEGFTLRGDQYWNGCANFNATITVEQNGFVIAGPINLTVDCDGEAIFTGLKLDVPRGTGYELKISGATVRKGIGGPVNQIGLVTVNPGGPFYNINLHSNQKCAKRDSVCMVSDCPCPDTSLTFPPNICANQTFNLNDLLTDSTSAGTWSIKTDPGSGSVGTIINDSIFDADGATAGNYTFLYSVTGTFAGCVVENERSLEVYKVDSAIMKLNQGPFCINDGKQNIELATNSTTGGTWSSSSSSSINTSTGEFDPADAKVGKHWIFYNSPSVHCPAKDSIEVEVTPQMTVSLTTADTSICLNTMAFIINKSGNTSPGGVWEGYSSDSLFTPDSVGIFKVKYIAGGLTANCSATDSLTITVIELDTASIKPDQGPFCINDGTQLIELNSNSTLGGTWSSSSSTSINVTTGAFDPADAKVGKHWVYYSSPSLSCPAIDSIEIEVTPKMIAKLSSTDTSVCLNSNDFIINKSSTTNSGGYWTGYSSDSLFIPDSIGVFKIKYSVAGLNSGCSDSDSLIITVIELDTASITPNQGPFCTVDGKFIIKAESNQTTGGVWSSNGPTNAINATTGEVDPTIMGTGFFMIYYNTPSTSCPDVDSLQIEITSAFVANIITPDTSLCYNASPFNIRLSANTTTGGTWKGQGVVGSLFDPSSVTPGNYSIKYAVYGLTTACSDSDSVVITVLPPDTAMITANQGPWCRLGSKDTLKIDPQSTQGGSWSSPSASIVGNTGEIDPLLSGEGKHWIYYTTAGTCSVKDSIEIEIIKELDALIKTSDTTVCADSDDFNLLLESSSHQTGNWAGIGVSGPSFSPNASGAGIFKVYYAVAGLGLACSDIDSIEVTVLPNQNATLTQPNPKDFCVGDSSITIQTADTGNNGVWWSEPKGNITSSGVFTPLVSNIGTIEIFYGIAGSCGDTSKVDVKVHPILDPTIDLVDPICEIGTDITLNAVHTGNWKTNGIVSTSTFSPQNLGPGMHEVINSIADFCPVSDTILIEVKENPTPVINADTLEGCFPLVVNFTDISDSNAITTTWSIYDGTNEIYTTSTIDSIAYTFLEEGCFDVSTESTFDFGCKNTATLPTQICTYEPPKADFNFTDTPYDLKDPKVYTANTSTNAGSFAWTFVPGRDLVNTDNALIVEYAITEQDTVDIQLVASNGWCADTVLKSVIIWDYYSLYIPNAFTPNEDGLNDVFYPYGKNHTTDDHLFLIYDRWGNRIWESTTPYEGWDGTYKSNGSSCQIDVYVWKIISKDKFNNSTQETTGIVSLIR